MLHGALQFLPPPRGRLEVSEDPVSAIDRRREGLKKGVADFSSGVQDMLDGRNDSNVLITIDTR
jgi:hypothetical protein